MMSKILIDRVETPLGPMTLAARDGVMLLLEFGDEKGRIERNLRARFGDAELVATANPFGFSDKIAAYFAGDLAAIETIPTDGGGSDFEKQVWGELKRIPCGVAISYGEIAKRLGDPQLARAVGTANNHNPISIVVPCHRVIGADGSLVGYGGGLHRKRWLLAHESATMPSAQGDLFSSGRAAE